MPSSLILPSGFQIDISLARGNAVCHAVPVDRHAGDELTEVQGLVLSSQIF